MKIRFPFLTGSFWPKLLLFLAILGPGIITGSADNDAAGITTYSVAGASFGYKILWVFIPMMIALMVVQEMNARMGAVTGKGLADLIRENYGARLCLLAMSALLVANIGTTISEFAGIAASLEIFRVNKYLSIPIAAFLIWFMVLRGSYKAIERIFLGASVLYFTYVASGIMANPPWKEVASSLFVPYFSTKGSYFFMVIALIGTTIAPWMQFYIQSSLVEKGITVEEYPYSRWDVVIGCFMTCFVALFIVVACAATLNKAGIPIKTAQDAAVALAPLAGKWASLLFAVGLLNASVFSAAILPLSTAYSICEAFGWEAGIDKAWQEAPVFYGLYTAVVIIGAAFILIPNLPLISVMLWSQVANGILLPFLLIFILRLINNRDLMGDHVNGRIFNGIAWLTTVFMIAMTLLLLAATIFPGLAPS